MAKTYTDFVETSGAITGLLGASLETVYTTTDVMTGGASLLWTTGARYATSLGLAAIDREARREANIVIARNLKKLEKERGWDLATMQTKSDQELEALVDDTGILDGLEAKLAGHPEGERIVRRAVIGQLRTVQKATLRRIAQNDVRLTRAEGKLAELGKGIEKLTVETRQRFDEVDKALVDIQTQLSEAQNTITSVQQAVAVNATQTQAIGAFLFQKATATERLSLLTNGYLEGVIPTSQRRQLLDATEKAARVEQFAADLARASQSVQAVGQIARTLGIRSEELNGAISFATGVSSAASDLAQGNVLGALVNITGLFGLFGSRPDPAAERHRQLMNYLGDQFEALNARLDVIIKSQQAILDGLVTLSRQQGAYFEAVNARFDQLSVSVSAIGGIANDILYLPLADCRRLQRDVLNAVGLLAPPVQPVVSSLGAMGNVAQNVAYAEVQGCISYLRRLYAAAFDPMGVDLRPLASRSWSAAPATRPANGDTLITRYLERSKAREFVADSYGPTLAFWSADPRQRDVLWHFASLAAPARNVREFTVKDSVVGTLADACIESTALSFAFIGVLCRDNLQAVGRSRRQLPRTRSAALEGAARQNVAAVAGTPLLHEGLVTLAEFALFFAPLADLSMTAESRFATSIDDVLKDGSTRAKGAVLLEEAMGTIAVATAQTNLMFGDGIAHQVFRELWDSTASAWRLESTFSPRQRAALNLAKGNPYLRQNVLMFALHQSARTPRSGEGMAYGFARKLLVTNEIFGRRQLRHLFGDGWDFAATCPAGALPPGATCEILPVARLYGMEVVVPTADDFAQRTLMYPQILWNLLSLRETIARRLADYRVFEEAEQDAVKRAKLIGTFIELQR